MTSQNSSNGDQLLPVVKGKRTKRPRCIIPAAAAAAAASSTSSVEFSGSATEEDEDMANCLMLLARGPSAGKAGMYVYECKTCSKCFPSFQALGGHRASHKKPKTSPPEEKKPAGDGGDHLQISMNSFSKTVKLRVHECSICGSEFSSGQALGGHMRRHRPLSAPEVPVLGSGSASTSASTEPNKKERSILSLDLNLPAPSDDDRPEAFPFQAPALVDCHY